jgi:arginine repressor
MKLTKDQLNKAYIIGFIAGLTTGLVICVFNYLINS